MHKFRFNQGLNDIYGLKTNLFIFQTFLNIDAISCQGWWGGFNSCLC